MPYVGKPAAVILKILEHTDTTVYKVNSEVIRGNATGDKHLP
jgi:hypothetical protein